MLLAVREAKRSVGGGALDLAGAQLLARDVPVEDVRRLAPGAKQRVGARLLGSGRARARAKGTHDRYDESAPLPHDL